MELTIKQVRTAEEITAVATLAKEIWNQHFTPLLPYGQVDYMLEKFQSEPAITAQIAEGYRYFLLQKGGKPIGYTGVCVKEGKLFLSKLYLLQTARGQGYSRAVLQFLESLCKAENLSAIWLTVNRYNAIPIAVYKALGFAVVREQVADIGNGYVMDDYIMEKQVEG